MYNSQELGDFTLSLSDYEELSGVTHRGFDRYACK